ncbi:porin [Bradyrhizobium sp. CCBAU 21362]|uniref:porin n=1 Tax=Bradyrhizobium sp. CCBAU 21362 TaxID=1325082 RepID=UPI0023059D1D|nr:porin [Bradyrhizobium sp. CCBAU 21362]
MASRWVATSALVGWAFSYSPSVAHAASSDDLRLALTRLQARVQQLEANKQTEARNDRAAAKAAKVAQKEAEEARARAEEARLQAEAARGKAQAAQSGADPLQGSFPGSMRIPGTNTSFRIFGYAKVHAYGDLGPRNRSDNIAGPSLPLSSGAQGAKTPGDVAVGARWSRVALDVRTPISESSGTARTYFEVDWAGQSDPTSQTTASSFTTRLRLAFGEFGNADGWGTVIAGQTYSVFSDCTLNPLRSVSDWTTPGTSAVRQAAIQYRKSYGATTVSVGLENTYSDVTSTAGTSYPDSNGGAGFTLSAVPDGAASVIWRGESAFFALRGLVRSIGINNEAAFALAERYHASTLGYGIGVTGGLNLLDNRLALFATANYGPGIGRYLITVSQGFGAVTNFGLPGVTARTAQIDRVTATAGLVGVQYKFLPNLQANALVSATSLGYPSYVTQFTTTSSAVNRSLWATSVNLIYSPLPSVDLGVEYLHGSRTLVVPDANGIGGGTADRIHGMVLVRF